MEAVPLWKLIEFWYVFLAAYACVLSWRSLYYRYRGEMYQWGLPLALALLSVLFLL